VTRANVTVPLAPGVTVADVNDAVAVIFDEPYDGVPNAGVDIVHTASDVLPDNTVSGVAGCVPEYHVIVEALCKRATKFRPTPPVTCARFT
jgi:hypothetical protein